MDPELWKIENYLDFLAERRKLLAKAANEFLDKLSTGTVPPSSEVSILEQPTATPVRSISDGDEQRLLDETNAWVVAQGLPEGEFSLELVNETNGQALGYLDLAWPNGLQEGWSQQVALLIDEEPETEEAANQAGYRFFTNVNAFRKYVEQEILAVTEVGE